MVPTNTPTIFFLKKSGSLGTFWGFRWHQSTKTWHHCNTYSDIRSKYFFKKKYVAISPRSGAHVGERNLFLSAIRRSYRRSKLACLTTSAKMRLLLKVFVLIPLYLYGTFRIRDTASIWDRYSSGLDANVGAKQQHPDGRPWGVTPQTHRVFPTNPVVTMLK